MIIYIIGLWRNVCFEKWNSLNWCWFLYMHDIYSESKANVKTYITIHLGFMWRSCFSIFRFIGSVFFCVCVLFMPPLHCLSFDFRLLITPSGFWLLLQASDYSFRLLCQQCLKPNRDYQAWLGWRENLIGVEGELDWGGGRTWLVWRENLIGVEGELGHY